jgi:hypothetical protein
VGREWDDDRFEVRHARGLEFGIDVPPALVDVLRRSDGTRSLRALLAEASLHAEGSPEVFIARCTRLLVDMLKRGFFEIV